MTPYVPPDWIGFDFVAVNKRVKIGESIKITAYITPQRTTESGKAYLMFKMQASGEGGIPTTVGIVKSQLVFPIQPVTVNVVSQSPTQPTPTPTSTTTPISPSQLEELSVSIDPKYVEVKPGDTANYMLTVNWYPPEWRGELTISAVISAAGFEKRYGLPSIALSSDPPITTQIPIPIPQAIPPFTYEVKVEVAADSLKASDEAVLKISQSTPGFEVLFAIVGLLTVAYLLRRH